MYITSLKTGEVFSHGGDAAWYLGSTVKVAVAIAVLQAVDAGRLTLASPVTLQDTDKIEAGPLAWAKTGSRHSLASLLKRMVVDSDNTASNMLIRSVGLDQVNEAFQAALGSTRSRLTNLAQVRYDVYAELHPDALKLSNAQLLALAAVPLGPQRVEALLRALSIQAADLQAKTLDEAYARYYQRGLNTARLRDYSAMLEKLVRGKLLSPASTQLLFQHMKLGIFTNYRLQAGLPQNVRFIHKTGTQYQRACHVGVINPENGGAEAIVVATCAAGLDEQREAGGVFERVGRAVTQTVLSSPPAPSPAKR